MTIKQEAFCHAYIETGNASEAYRRCYSCGRMKTETINRMAHDLINNRKITARVRLLQSELKKSSDIRKEDLLEELSCFAFSDIRDYVEFDGTTVTFKAFNTLTDKQARAIEGVKKAKDGSIELKLHGKSWSIERICKMLGLDAPDKLQVEETGSVPITNWLKKNGKSKTDEQ